MILDIMADNRSERVAVPTPRGEVCVELKPSYSCSQRCEFCIWGARKRRKTMRNDQILRTFSFINSHVMPSYFVLSGGEPLLHKEANLILTSIGRLQSVKHFHLHTNATCVSRVKPELLTQTAPFRSAMVGIHGHDKTSYESISMVPGSFEKALSGIQMLKELGFLLRSCVVICKRNCSSLIEMTDFLLGRGFDLVELRLPIISDQQTLDKIAVYYSEIEQIAEAWLSRFSHCAKTYLCASGALCFGNSPICPVPMECWFFDVEHQAEKGYCSQAQPTAVWPEAFEGYVKSEACLSCVAEAICPGYSTYEVSYGYAQYNPLTIDDLVLRSSTLTGHVTT
jgi:MoaA/NifB/PqqE/SkfB family radical SAM enzyme